jgi:hypothetical protein
MELTPKRGERIAISLASVSKERVAVLLSKNVRNALAEASVRILLPSGTKVLPVAPIGVFLPGSQMSTVPEMTSSVASWLTVALMRYQRMKRGTLTARRQ